MNTTAYYYYLKDNRLAERTIKENTKDILRFNQWAIENNYNDITHLNYNDLLKYVQYMKNQSLSNQTINIRVNSLRKYYEHLKQEKTIEKNPAKHLRIKGELKRVTENPLNYNDLETLYTNYEIHIKDTTHHLRNLTTLGLMIWQGVHSGEMDAMEIKHVQLEKGIIYIPGTRRSNSRELKLESKQIITLHSYLNTLEANQEELFKKGVHSWMGRFINELKGINPIIKNLQHIRASVILHWIKMYDKRQVQYMAGHRYISTTQTYEVQEMDSLTDLLKKYHPFG